VYQHAEHGINEASRKFGQSSENHRSYLRAFLLFEMASSANFNNVLKQLTAIFRRLNSGEDALSEDLKNIAPVFWPKKGGVRLK
jgi:hypothetical protein